MYSRMHPATRSLGAIALLALSLAACDDDDYGDGGPTAPPPPQATVITASGDLTAKRGEYRALLGEPNNGGTAGEQAAGRREIAWDGAGANPFNNKDNFPADFFNNLGAVFTTPGTGFRNDSLKFAEVDASYAEQFSTFSPTKIFAAVGSNRMDVIFHVAGSQTPAAVSGFGVIFSDVDKANVSSIEFFDAAGKSLGKFAAPIRSDAAGLSFVGVKFVDPTVRAARVRITLGEAALKAGVKDVSTQGGTSDLVVVDNFIYGEPKAIVGG